MLPMLRSSGAAAFMIALVSSDPAAANPTTSSAAEILPQAAAIDVDNRRRSSTSCGAVNRGSLHGARKLPAVGKGYVIREPWLGRGLHYGTDELVSLIERVAARVHRTHGGGLLGIGDLSAADGGAAARHRSHQAGRDADLIYYAVDNNGQPFDPDEHMAYFAHNGRATYAEAPEWSKSIDERYFDLPRNWTLVEALVTDPVTPVQRIFVSERVRRWLLAYAEVAGVPAEIVAQVEAVMGRPNDSSHHNDHMHIRIGCSAEDIARGNCQDDLARRRKRGKWHTRVPCRE